MTAHLKLIGLFMVPATLIFTLAVLNGSEDRPAHCIVATELTQVDSDDINNAMRVFGQ